jgi:hypothetical protein
MHVNRVFLGPSLPVAIARSILDADYQPPARRGDIYRCLASGLKTIVLIDGVFHCEQSVWQRELVDAMREGLTVVGASSMGALRAAELHTLGMIGVGTVFERYRTHRLEDDDEVALMHGDAASGWRALSEPMVNLRCTFERAALDGVLSPEMAQRFIDAAKRLYYPDRSYAALLESPVAQGLSDDARQRLRSYLGSHRVDIKREDALAALRLVADGAPAGGVTPPRRRERTLYQIANNERMLRRRVQLGGWSGDAFALHDTLAPAVRQRMIHALVARWYLVHWAEQRDVHCPAEVREEFQRAFLERAGVSDLSGWLRSRALTALEFGDWIADAALADWLTRMGPRFFGLAAATEAPSERFDPAVAPFLRDWARHFGLRCPDGDAATLDWLVAEDPRHFGFNFSPQIEVGRELQMSPTQDGW